MAEIRYITLPASLPYIFTGLKMAVAYATVAVVAGEFILSGAGLGYQIAFAYNNFDNLTMYSLMFLLLVSVGAINVLLSRLGAAAVRPARREVGSHEIRRAAEHAAPAAWPAFGNIAVPDWLLLIGGIVACGS